MNRIYFDIETGPRPESEIASMMPEFSAPSNYKDAAKIADAIEKQKAAWIEKAALCATTGKVLAIGVRANGASHIFASGDEADDLRVWWAFAEQCARDGDVLVGFYIAGFDVPFLVRRSWALGVPVPLGVFSGRYLNHHVFLDLAEEWQCGDRTEKISLKRLAEFLGVGTKDANGGAAFAEKWKTDRAAAIAYLENDLLLTEAVANKILGPWPPVAILPTFTAPPSSRKRMAKVTGVVAPEPEPAAVVAANDDY
jgi:hypothetical protein